MRKNKNLLLKKRIFLNEKIKKKFNKGKFKQKMETVRYQRVELGTDKTPVVSKKTTTILSAEASFRTHKDEEDQIVYYSNEGHNYYGKMSNIVTYLRSVGVRSVENMVKQYGFTYKNTRSGESLHDAYSKVVKAAKPAKVPSIPVEQISKRFRQVHEFITAHVEEKKQKLMEEAAKSGKTPLSPTKRALAKKKRLVSLDERVREAVANNEYLNITSMDAKGGHTRKHPSGKGVPDGYKTMGKTSPDCNVICKEENWSTQKKVYNNLMKAAEASKN